MGRPKRSKTNTSVINVKINEDNEIELLEVDETTQDTIHSDAEITDEEDAEDDPELIQTRDGHMMLTLDKTLVEHICGKCDKTFKSFKLLNRHMGNCAAAIVQDSNPSRSGRVIPKKESEVLKNVKAEKSDEFAKYYIANPKNPCFCCGEELAKAHVGHIKCDKCPKSFKTKENHDQHISNLHSENKKYACTSCNAKCPSKQILNLHLKTHASGKPFSCVHCGKDFTRKYHLDRHLNHTNCSGAKPKVELPCEVCGKVFSRIDNLRDHLRGHMGQVSRKRDFQCPYCDKSFYGSSLLNIHIRTHTGEKPFPCDLCPKSFPSNGALRKHRRMHTGERPYSCSVCESRFSAKETLNRHMKTHTGVKPHVCSICGNSFIQATQLRSHMFHHTGENGHECTQCKRVFNRKNRLLEHIKYVHEGAKPFQCELCPKHFTRKEDLNRHLDLHKGIKNYVCDTCEKKFYTKGSLKLHLRIHKREEPSQCNECNRKFKRVDCLIRHMRAKHRESMHKIISDAEKRRLSKVKNTITAGNTVFEIRELNGTALTAPDVVDEDDDDDDDVETIDEEAEVISIDENPEEDVEDSEEDDKKNSTDPEDILANTPIFLSDDVLKQSIAELLTILIDDDMLKEFGWPEAPVEDVLDLVIKRCGHKPAIENTDEAADYITRMRENSKLLFTLVLDNDRINSLLNNHTVDEVIMYVLKISK